VGAVAESLAASLTAGGTTGLIVYGIAFVGGILAGFGPCVLPMLPAIFGWITGASATEIAKKEAEAAAVAGGAVAAGDTMAVGQRASWMRPTMMMAAFVFGMSMVFTGVGVGAVLLGRAIFVGAWANYLVAAICIVLGLQMLGLINIRFDALNRFLPQKRPESRTIGGAMLFGAVFGLVASPCTTPILLAIAAIAASSGSVAQGGAMLFLFGLGKGVPLILVGVLSASIVRIGKLSNFAEYTTKFSGAMLLFAGAYLVWIA